MTCIVGIATDGKVYIGGDSYAGREADYRRITNLRKVFKIGEFLIGYAGSFRMGQILQYHLEVRQQQDGETDDRFMVVAFAEAVRTVFKDKGFTWLESGRESGGQFLVGYRGKLYDMDSDFQVNTFQNGVMALGCGEQYALGAMLALNTLTPKKRITRALEIAAEMASVAPPFVIESI